LFSAANISTTITALNTAIGSSKITALTAGTATDYTTLKAVAPTVTGTPALSATSSDTITMPVITNGKALFIGVSTSASLLTPSAEQLFNCVDSANVTLPLCKEVILLGSTVLYSLFIDRIQPAFKWQRKL
jgi:hypothetical protein